MQLSAEHKLKIEQQLVEAIFQALEKGLLTEEEEAVISPLILEKMPQIGTREDLIVFLRELSEKSRIFSPLMIVESGEVKDKTEDSIAEKVESLTQDGKIDEAISLAQTITNKGA